MHMSLQGYLLSAHYDIIAPPYIIFVTLAQPWAAPVGVRAPLPSCGVLLAVHALARAENYAIPQPPNAVLEQPCLQELQLLDCSSVSIWALDLSVGECTSRYQVTDAGTQHHLALGRHSRSAQALDHHTLLTMACSWVVGCAGCNNSVVWLCHDAN